MIIACTVVTRSHLAQAEVLNDSLRAFHPDLPLKVLLVDEKETEVEGPRDNLELIYPKDVGVDDTELHRFAAMYEALELVCALKPSLILTLLKSADVVIYLDSDIEIFAPLTQVVEVARKEGLVLTPHHIWPGEGPDAHLIDYDNLLTGRFNAGFIAAGPGSEPFLKWWKSKLRFHCKEAHKLGLCSDQRWLDCMPGIFSYRVCTDAGCNVACWNLEERCLEWSEADGYRVTGKKPLRFFHFSAYDPESGLWSQWLTPRQRAHCDSSSAVKQICLTHRDRLNAKGHSQLRKVGYAFANSASGRPMDPWIRWIYRAHYFFCEMSGTNKPLPDPFTPSDQDNFAQLLKGPPAGEMPGYLLHIYENRQDLQAAFPDPRGLDRDRLFDWAKHSGPAEVEMLEYVRDM
jgi:hypothetical protein